MNGKNCLIVSLSTILVSTLALASTTGGGNLYSPNYGWAGQGTYDPWLDVNDDGKIDVNDSIAVWQAYGTTGNPTKIVRIQRDFIETCYNITIPPNYVIIGFMPLMNVLNYSQITVALRAEGPGVAGQYITVSIAFKLAGAWLSFIKSVNVEVKVPDPIFPCTWYYSQTGPVCGSIIGVSYTNPQSYTVNLYIGIYLTS